jgi:hypothetical protein
MKWNNNRNIWNGECPRCGVNSYFNVTWSHIFSDHSSVDIIECPEGHPFMISTTASSLRRFIEFITPVSGDYSVPKWLPIEYSSAYSEMMFDFKSKKYRSAVALAGIILDAHINSLLRNPGDKKKTLANRMEILSKQGNFDTDQFAEGTVARLGRNDVMHPDQIINNIEENEALEAIEAVSGCLERFYKFRRAKALPAPEEQIES